MKKYAILLVFLSAVTLSYGQNYIGFNLGTNFFTDKYTDDNYSRKQFGYSTGISYYFFKEDFPLGLYGNISLGGSSPWQEDNSRENMKARKSRIVDFRLAVAPSFRFKLGSVLFIPLSLGPIFVFTNEKSTEKLISGETDYSYQTLSGGLNANAAVVIVFPNGFFIRPGISLDWLFLRAEKGEMRMNYRTTHNKSFEKTPYYAISLGLYFGFGMKF